MNLKRLLLIGAAVLAASSVMAQGFRGGGRGMFNSPVMLLSRDDVKNDLGLTDDQRNKLAELRSSTMTEFQNARQTAGEDRGAIQKAMAEVMKGAEDKINAILTDDQKKRLKQIQLQLGGYGAIAHDGDLQSQLAVTDTQKSTLKQISDASDAANKSVWDKVQSHEIEFSDARSAMKKNQDALNSAVEGVLTADQKAKFKDLGGKTFTPTDQPGGGFGRGGGR